MNRKERRAVEHQARKAARKAGFPIAAPNPSDKVANVSESVLSPARLAANRANALLSTGPSEAGKAISSQNRLTHGLARHNGVFKLLTSEDPAGFEALKASLISDHQPQNATESILVIQMAESHWLAQRAQSLQFTCLDPETGQITDTKMAALYLRYEFTHRRAYHKSLNDLLKLRSQRHKQQRGFEAQKRQEEDLALEQQIDAENQAWQNPTFRQDTIRMAMAKLNKDPEHPRIRAEWMAKYGNQKEQPAAA